LGALVICFASTTVVIVLVVVVVPTLELPPPVVAMMSKSARIVTTAELTNCDEKSSEKNENSGRSDDDCKGDVLDTAAFGDREYWLSPLICIMKYDLQQTGESVL
jgi:hypothetical protein